MKVKQHKVRIVRNRKPLEGWEDHTSEMSDTEFESDINDIIYDETCEDTACHPAWSFVDIKVFTKTYPGGLVLDTAVLLFEREVDFGWTWDDEYLEDEEEEKPNDNS